MVELKKNVAARVPVRLFDSATGAPLNGVPFSGVTVTVERADGTTHTLTILESDWSQTADGAFANAGKYTLLLPVAAVSVAGCLTYAVAYAGARTFVGAVKVVDNEEVDTFTRLGAPAGASVSVDIATRLAAASYVAPDNAGIASNGVAIAAVGLDVTARPTNPVLDDDVRLDALDAAVSSRATVAGVEASTVLAKEATVAALEATLTLIRKRLGNRARLNDLTKQWVIYDDDGVTPLFAYTTYDKNGAPSVDKVYEKVPVP